jgi:hypothetical protein
LQITTDDVADAIIAVPDFEADDDDDDDDDVDVALIASRAISRPVVRTNSCAAGGNSDVAISVRCNVVIPPPLIIIAFVVDDDSAADDADPPML